MASFASPVGEPVQCRGPRSCGAWNPCGTTHCRRCQKYIPRASDSAFHTGPSQERDQPAPTPWQGGANKRFKGGHQQSASGAVVGEFDVAGAKTLRASIIVMYGEDVELVKDLDAKILAAEAKASSDRSDCALRGTLAAEAKKLAFQHDKKVKQLIGLRKQMESKQMAQQKIMQELEQLQATATEVQDSVMELECQIRDLGCSQESADMQIGRDSLADGFLQSLPASLKDSHAAQIEQQLQRLQSELQQAAAEASRPAFVEELGDLPDGNFGAADLEVPSNRTAPYEGGAAVRAVDKLASWNEGLAWMSERIQAGQITSQDKESFEGQLTSLQAALAGTPPQGAVRLHFEG